MTPPVNTTVPGLGIDRRFLGYLRPYWGPVTLAMLMIIVQSVLETLAPLPIKVIIDNVIGGQVLKDRWDQNLVGLALNLTGPDQRVQTAVLGVLMLLLTLLLGAAGFVYEYLSGLIQEGSTLQLRTDVFGHVQHLPLEFYDKSRRGDLIKRMTDDTGKVMAALVGSLGEVLVNVTKFAAFAAMMLAINWRFSIIVLAYAPLLLFLFVAFRRNIRAVSKAARNLDGQMHSQALETVGAIRLIKAFGRERYEQDRYAAQGADRARAGMRTVRWEASFGPVVDLIQAASTAAVIWYGVSQVLIGQLSVGELVLFLTYLTSIYKPLKKFGALAGDLQKAAASGDRLSELLDVDVRIVDAPDALPLRRARGALSLEGVHFVYGSRPDRPVLRDINLAIRPGETVALVGSTGSGKSTVCNLLMRLYDVSVGSIRLDGHDLRHLRVADVRAQFAYVPQEAVLFTGTVRDNIAYGRQDASEAEIMAAARAANAEEFILRLPGGYDSVIGEQGSALSGGQRQRLAIARALLRDAPILILDEPTSALDAESEDLVMSALQRLMHGRTTIIIAHRLSTIRDADRIIVLDQGQIIEQGRHQELVSRDGQYAHLMRLQAVPQ